MFQAGVNSARAQSPRRWVWPAIAASLAVVALSESALLAGRPGAKTLVVQQSPPGSGAPAVKPEPVVILVQAPPSLSSEQEPWLPGGGATLGLRRQVLRFGLEGLPDPPPLLSQADGAALPPGTDSETPGLLRRYEFSKVLDLGGPS
jgi:hypothetical protein